MNRSMEYLQSEKAIQIMAEFKKHESYNSKFDPQSAEYIGHQAAYYAAELIWMRWFLYGLWNSSSGGQCFGYLNEAFSCLCTGSGETENRNWAA